MIAIILSALIVILYVGCGLILISNIIALIKNNFTYKNQSIILEAICKYELHLIKEERYDEIRVSFKDMESYDATQRRWYDWGYTRILPSEKFELIKPFINTERRVDNEQRETD